MQKTKNQPLKLGFIGGGLSSAVGLSHYSACQMDGMWQLCAGAFSRNAETNQQTAAQWNVSPNKLYSNWQNLIDSEKENLDALCILTHTPHHAEVIEYAAQKNVPIICEKSIVMNSDELAKIKKIPHLNNNFFASIFNYTGYPLIRELKALIEDGRLGKIQQIHIEMPQEGLIRPPDIAGKAAPPQSWRLVDGKIPTICLDLGVHMHNMIYFLTSQEPSHTLAEFGNYSAHKLVDYITMFLRFQTGMKGTLWMTKTALGNRNGLKIRVFGEKASASWYQLNPEKLNLNYLNGKKEIIDRGSDCLVARELRYNRMKSGHTAGFIEAFANLYYDIALAFNEFQKAGSWQNPYVYGFKEAENGIKLFEAAAQSFEEQKWVETGI